MERETRSARNLNTSAAIATLSLCVGYTCQRTASLQAALMDIRKFFKNRGDQVEKQQGGGEMGMRWREVG